MSDYTATEYMLNAVEHAAKAKNPAKAGYAGKRVALVRQIRWLHDMIGVGGKAVRRANWLAANAHKQIDIRYEDGLYEVRRWHTRYVSYHAWTGRSLDAAIDAAIESGE